MSISNFRSIGGGSILVVAFPKINLNFKSNLMNEFLFSILFRLEVKNGHVERWPYLI